MQLKVMRDTFCEVAQMSDTLSNSRNVLSICPAFSYIILEISSKNDELSNQVNLLGFELIGRLLAPDCNQWRE